jgi:serine/threonine-protein kinase
MVVGQTLGHYKILEKLGAGGMGGVYLAEDTRLGREVAIKVLPEAFTSDPERLARFEREAKVLASLNHPRIAQIHGLEEVDGQQFLVLELVEGPTLAERAKKGPIPVDEALSLAIQIAEALEVAHEKGIVHRDLKPANIKLTLDGEVKVLDFGLAKPVEVVGSPDLTHSPTLTYAPTQAGVLLGTAAYMSPEQVRGQEVDKRSDIWAFGVVLWEMLTGKRLFKGETVSDVLAAVLQKDVALKELPRATPRAVHHLLRHCLTRDLKERLHDIADARIEIEETLAEPLDLAQPVPEHWLRRAVPWALALFFALVAGIAFWSLRSPFQPGTRSVVHVRMGLQPAEMLGVSPGLVIPGIRLSRTAMALSADGSHLVYAGGDEESSRLYLRKMDEPEARPIPGTEGGLGPFLSPDGRWVGFWSDGALKKVSIDGGPPTALYRCEIPPFGASWGLRNTIVFGQYLGSLLQISAGGGMPEPITTVDPEEGQVSHRLPHILPDGESVLFTARNRTLGDYANARIEVQSLVSNERRVLVENAADARYSSTGHLIFVRLGTLMAAPFDASRVELTGAQVALINDIDQATRGVGSYSDTAAAQFAFSNSGSLVWVPSRTHPVVRSLVWVDREGVVEALNLTPQRLLYPRISPDGARVVMSILKEGINDVWVYELSRGNLSRLTSSKSNDWRPIWTPEGTHITFSSDRDTLGIGQIFQMPWDGSGPANRLTRTQGKSNPSSWKLDGRALAFVHRTPDLDDDIWILSPEGEAQPFIQSRFDAGWPAFSPDGKWLAYGSNETGRYEVYVRPYPGPGPRVQISMDGGDSPAWARNGKELFYQGSREERDGTSPMMVVDIETDPEFQAGIPKVLFRNRMWSTIPVRTYDVTPDGEHFLMVREDTLPLEEVTEFHAVLNWFEELKRLVPTR